MIGERWISIRVDGPIATRDTNASQVHEAFLFNIIEFQLLGRLDITMPFVIDMPCSYFSIAMTVEKKDEVGKSVVVVENVGEVRGRLSAFVDLGVERCGRVVYSVYCVLPAEAKKSISIIFSRPFKRY